MTRHATPPKQCRHCDHVRNGWAERITSARPASVLYCHRDPSEPTPRVYPTHYCAAWTPDPYAFTVINVNPVNTVTQEPSA